MENQYVAIILHTVAGRHKYIHLWETLRKVQMFVVCLETVVE